MHARRSPPVHRSFARCFAGLYLEANLTPFTDGLDVPLLALLF